MNVDQLTAKFAQAYTKRADRYYNGESVEPLSPADITRMVQGAQNRDAYLKTVDSNEDSKITDTESGGFKGTPTLIGAGAGVPISLLLHSILAKDKSLAAYLKSALIGGAAGAGIGYLGGTKFAQNSPLDSTGGFFSEPGTPFQVQTGPAVRMSETPELLARPIETQQSYGGGAFLDPTNAGFYSPFLDVPFVGADQRGFGTGSTLLSGLGAYVGTKGLLNRALLDPRSYLPGLPGVPRAPMYMTPEAADAQLSRSLGVTTGAANEVEGVKNPLSAVAIQPVGGAGKPVSVSTPNPTALRTEMASQGMVGPGVNSNAASDDIPRVEITATRPGPVTTTARFNPQTPLLRPGSRIPTLRGAQAALAPRILGGLPTGARGSLRGRFPLYAGLAGIGIPQILNAYNAAYAAPDDPTGAPFSGFIPRVGYNPAILGEEPGLFYSSPTLYEDVVGRDVPIQ